jgi:hypothetical protein
MTLHRISILSTVNLHLFDDQADFGGFAAFEKMVEVFGEAFFELGGRDGAAVREECLFQFVQSDGSPSIPHAPAHGCGCRDQY